jgi:alpha-L-fucosidase
MQCWALPNKRQFQAGFTMTDINALPEKWRWFPAARYGMFLHWGPYSAIGRGEQVFFREHLNPRDYEQAACKWNPKYFDAREWAQSTLNGGFKYAVFTTRHHDGYCLWDSKLTDYNSARQAPLRDFVREYVEAFREVGLKVGLYYSLADWRIPAYWEGPQHDPEGWSAFRDYVHNQMRELLSNYGTIDVIWFDGAWPRNAQAWQSEKLIAMMRELQPNLLINNRLDAIDPEHGVAQWQEGAIEGAGESKRLGDLGTPEHHITAEKRIWESCQTSTSRLWGYTSGEHWRTPEQLLDFICEASSQGGNLLLNVGPDGEGRIPTEFTQRTRLIGEWLQRHGEAIYGTQRGDVVEFVTRGWQTVKGNSLYLILRFWDGQSEFRLAGLSNSLLRAELLSTGQKLDSSQSEDESTGRAIVLHGLPEAKPTQLFPVIKLEFDGSPSAIPALRERLWCGNPRRMTAWARQRGNGMQAFQGD